MLPSRRRYSVANLNNHADIRSVAIVLTALALILAPQFAVLPSAVTLP